MSRVRDEVDELLGRLTASEKHDLLDSLWRKWVDERTELRRVLGEPPNKERADADG